VNSDELLGIGEVAKLLGRYLEEILVSVLKKGIFLKHKTNRYKSMLIAGTFEVKEKMHQISSSKRFNSSDLRNAKVRIYS
jgi:phage antirepressor YoqD-like protein